MKEAQARKQRSDEEIATAQESRGALLALLGDRFGNIIDASFRRMEAAEEEIAAAKHNHPRREKHLHGAFLHLCPSDVLQDAPEKLYRAHCRELLDRVAAGRDMRPATDAELLSLLSTLSLAAPLDRPATLLYWETFKRSFPAEAASLRADLGPVAADDYDRERAKDLDRTLRRKLHAPGRRLAPP